MLLANDSFASPQTTLQSCSVPMALAAHFDTLLQRWIAPGAVLSPLALPTVLLELDVRRADGSPATGELIVLQTDSFRRAKGAPLIASRVSLDAGKVALPLKFPITRKAGDGAAFDLFFCEVGVVSGVRLSLDATTCHAAHCLLSERAPQLESRTLADRFFTEQATAVHAVAPMTLEWRNGQGRLQRNVQLPV